MHQAKKIMPMDAREKWVPSWYPNKQPASSRGLAVADTTCTPSLRLARRFAIAAPQIETLSSFLFAVPMGAGIGGRTIFFFNRVLLSHE
jgi:hypothetical protein